MNTSTSNKPNASIRRKLSFVDMLGDFAFGFIGLSLGYFVRFHTPFSQLGNINSESNYTYLNYFPLITLGTIFLVLSFFRLKVYSWRNLLRTNLTIRLVSKAILIWFIFLLGISFVVRFEPQISRIYMACALATTFFSIWFWKHLFSCIVRNTTLNKVLTEQIMFVGWSEEAQSLADAVHRNENHSYTVSGVIDTDNRSGPSVPEKVYPKVGHVNDLDTLLQKRRPEIVVIADPELSGESLGQIAELCELHYAELKIIPSMFQIFLSSLHMESVSGVPILGLEAMPLDNIATNISKRIIDLVGATVGLALCAPIILTMAFLIKREDRGPIFYSQKRTGYMGRLFDIYKLRSMRIDADQIGDRTCENDSRRLKIGEFMRKWNIDEMPQFWNVLKGDMSLVGPRPEVADWASSLQREIKRYNRRHHVKPGLSGWAQVNGLRGDTSLTERIRYDLFYIENASLILDFQIMFLTFFKRDNAY